MWLFLSFLSHIGSVGCRFWWTCEVRGPEIGSDRDPTSQVQFDFERGSKVGE